MATPSRLVLCVGGVLGLLMIVLAPGWFAGADEGTHLVRSVAMANGQFLPERLDGSLRSTVPAAHSESIGAVIRASATHDAPNSGELLGRLLDIRPDWNDTVRFDTGSTMASSPVAYAPSALFMVLPNALDAPPIVTLWFGRLGDLLVYLALAVLAVRTAVAFRWTLAIAAVVPMNLAMAASVSPDAVTIGSLLVVLALWTRIWRATGDPDPLADRLFVPLWRVGASVGGAGLLLALAKPPYFAALAAFPALLLVRRSDPRARVAAAAASAAIGVGVLASLFSTSNEYRSAGAGMFADLRFQPDEQLSRILDSPVGFLGRCVGRWVGAVPESVQAWTRQLGFWRTGLPAAVAWLFVIGLIVAAMSLDADDFLALRRFCRSIFVIGSAAIVLALMTSSYVYFDDTVEGVHMTEQIARYSLPLFAMALMGWAPRWPLRGRVLVLARSQRWRTVAVGGVAVAVTACVGAAVVTWWWTAGRFTGY